MSPPSWPERPGNAQDFDVFWLVRGLPPDPFPGDYDYGSDPARFGPPGTRWIFSTESLINRETEPGVSTLAKAGIERLVRKLAIKLPPIGSMGWTTPLAEAPPADPVGEPMRWARITINGTLAGVETLSHTLSLQMKPDPAVDQGVASIQTLANQVRDAWLHIFTTATPDASVQGLQGALSQQLVYTDVTAAYLEQTAPAVITTHKSRKTGRDVKDFAIPRATYLVPTQYANFPAGTAGTKQDNALPFEVATCVSLKTGLRGPRNNGRLYLGGISSSLVGAQGLFSDAWATQASKQIAHLIQLINSTTGTQVVIQSRAYNTAVPVTGTTCGVVPDSQRRRRRSQLEKYRNPIDPIV